MIYRDSLMTNGGSMNEVKNFDCNYSGILITNDLDARYQLLHEIITHSEESPNDSGYPLTTGHPSPYTPDMAATLPSDPLQEPANLLRPGYLPFQFPG